MNKFHGGLFLIFNREQHKTNRNEGTTNRGQNTAKLEPMLDIVIQIKKT